MRSFLIAVVLGLTGLTFYSALAYKSKFIEDDITKRVTDDLTASNAQGVGIDVDGRHVTLSGIVYDEAQETAYLKTANDTYGALGPIDGLTYQTDGGYVSAQKTDTGIALRGSVPNEAARASLLEAAAAATDGEVDDQLVISGPEADWQGETQFGMQQLAALSTGAMTASAAGYVLSGTTDGDVAAVADPVAEREGWSAFVSSPVVATGLQGQVADLNGQIAARDETIGSLNERLTAKDGEIATVTQERDALDSRLAALKDGMTDELVTGESLRADLLSARADLDTANATISERDATIAAFNAEKSTLVSRTLDTDTKLADTEQKLSGAKATIVALTAATAVKDGTIKDLNGRVSELETDLANRQQALGSTDEQVAALRAEVAERDAGLGEANAKIVALNNELGGQDDTIDVLEAQVAEKDATLGTANETISALTADLGAREETIAGLEAQVTKLDAEVYTLGATVAARDTTIANLNDRLNDTSSNLQSDNERIAVLATMVQERDASLADSEANVALLTSQGAEKDSDIGALSGQVNVLRGRVATLTDQAGAKDAEIGTLTGRISDLEGVVANRDAALGDADAKVAALMDTSAAKDADVDTLTGKVGELTAVVAARDATIASLRAQGGSVNVAEQCAAQASNVMEGARINFGSGNARITPESTILLERLTGIALACVGDDLTVEIGGHTDSQGSEAANKALSERRAQAVLAFMAERGVPANGVQAVGYGEGSPIADNATAAGRAANRRITFEWQAR